MSPEPITLVWSNLVTDCFHVKELLSVVLEEIYRQQEEREVADRGLERLDALVGIARSQIAALEFAIEKIEVRNLV
jgi:hypothetical protein